MQIKLINSGSPYTFNTIEEAAKFARSQAQVQSLLDQIQPELVKIMGDYRWSLHSSFIKRGRGHDEFCILAHWNGQTWNDTTWHRTPNKALVNLLKRAGILS